MTTDLFGDVNWLAVVVGGIAYFALGGLWFMPKAFGNVWMRAIDWQPDESESPGPAIFVAPFVSALVAATVLAVVAAAAGADSLLDGLVLGLLAGVGIAVTVLFVTATFDPKTPRPWTWFAVNAGYHTLGIVVAAVIVAVWR